MRVEPVGLPIGSAKGAGGEAERDWFETTPTVVSLRGRERCSADEADRRETGRQSRTHVGP